MIGIGFVWICRRSYDGCCSSCERAGAVDVALAVAADHLGDLRSPEVRGHRHDADAAELEEGERVRVVAGVEVEPRLLGDEPRLLGIVDRLLHGHDVVDLGEPRDRGGLDVDDDAARDVVGDDRQVGGGRDLLEVADDRALRRLVVVRRDDEDPVDAELGRLFRQVDGVACVVGAGAGDDGGALPDRLDRCPEEVAASPRRSASATRRSCRRRRARRSRCRRETPPALGSASRSTAPSGVNGVTIAVITEPSLGEPCIYLKSTRARPATPARRKRRPRRRWGTAGSCRRASRPAPPPVPRA